MAKRAAIYARVSTLAGQSPAMQLDVLREFAGRRGLEILAEFVDHGASGARERARPWTSSCTQRGSAPSTWFSSTGSTASRGE